MFLKKNSSVSEVLAFGAKALTKKSPTPILDAELMLCSVLDLSRARIISAANEIVEDKFLHHFKDLLNKRLDGYSVAQVIQKKHFWKSEFVVTKDTFAPRPDTETLIEAVLSCHKDKKKNIKIAEFGTGTGCIIISLLKEYKNAIGYGFEKNIRSYFVTKKNIKKHALQSRLQVFCKSFTRAQEILTNIDILVSNPPYIKKFEIKSLQPEIQKEPIMALDGGVGGFLPYIQIFKIAKKILKKNGEIFVEIGDNQENFLKCCDKSLQVKQLFKDLSGKVRIIRFCVL